MPYPTLPGRRFEYDIGGGSVYTGNDIGDITTILSQELTTKLNSENNSAAVLAGETVNTKTLKTVWLFLPEKVLVAGLGMVHSLTNRITADGEVLVAGSPDSTNGLDGTWLDAVLPNGAIPPVMMDDDVWRDSIQPCTFSEPVKVLRIRYQANASGGSTTYLRLYALHLYGMKAVGEIPDDILFLDDDSPGDPEFIRDLDWGDRQEGTTIMKRIKLFNSSTTKIAHNLSLSLVDTDFLFSMDEGITWITEATITSLSPQGMSASMIVKNTIPPPTQLLGPRAPRFEVSIGSWS
jgi:hypothetical protein